MSNNKANSGQPQNLDAFLSQNGLARMVPALVMPEVTAVIDETLDGGKKQEILARSLAAQFKKMASNPAGVASLIQGAPKLLGEIFAQQACEDLARARQSVHDLLTLPVEHDLSDRFLSAWRQWTAPVLKLRDFPHACTTDGATEGLRAAVNTLPEGSTVHIFDGEYEGFAKYAPEGRITVQSHPRSGWRQAIGNMGPQDRFYLSQPSAIDGNIWEDFDAFATELAAKKPDAKILIDVTYVGAVARPYQIDCSHKNVEAVFFSLSKPLGLQKLRIGGCLSQEDYQGLAGNNMRVNVLTAQVGLGLMEKYGVRELPLRYQPLQKQLTAKAEAILGTDLKPCDVVLLAGGKPGSSPSPLEQHLMRASGDESRLRVCLTPSMQTAVDNNSVPPAPLP